MKITNKGKVHHSSDSSSSQSPSKEKDILSILELLPATILTLVSVLSLDDKEVLAYMMTHSMKTTLVEDSKKKPPSFKKVISSTRTVSRCFDRDSFDCYTGYWEKWNNSPNHQVIQQAIEAFEDHLSKDESSRKSNNRPRKSKNSRKSAANSVLDDMGNLQTNIPTSNTEKISCLEDATILSSNNGAARDGVLENEGKVKELDDNVAVSKEEIPVTRSTPVEVNNRKGITRKVLPDVMGIFNSRLWNLWRPNV